jgi:hypothetical protein
MKVVAGVTYRRMRKVTHDGSDDEKDGGDGEAKEEKGGKAAKPKAKVADIHIIAHFHSTLLETTPYHNVM